MTNNTSYMHISVFFAYLINKIAIEYVLRDTLAK